MSPWVEDVVLRGTYESDECQLLEDVLEPQDIVLEVGTGIGVVSTLCARRIGSERVFTYEANPDLEPWIRETWALNGVHPVLTICAVGGADGEVVFFRDRHLWSSSVLPMHAGMRPVRVPSRSLTAEAARHRPTLLIVDAEGAEREMFRGADLPTVTRIVVELHEKVIGPEGVATVRADLAALGFVEDAALSRGEQMVMRRAESPR
jgi:FkbM family methyltransferase